MEGVNFMTRNEVFHGLKAFPMTFNAKESFIKIFTGKETFIRSFLGKGHAKDNL